MRAVARSPEPGVPFAMGTLSTEGRPFILSGAPRIGAPVAPVAHSAHSAHA